MLCNFLRPAAETLDDAVKEVFELVGKLEDDDKDMRINALKNRIDLALSVILDKAESAKGVEDTYVRAKGHNK
ncbi:unnamed protein product [Commensalibacter communis]|uniref:Uncharacterized protein n=1 Tax=Commensalibacter communis TaxID=2972786 RepID=A0A9W4TNK2_9PROT|nr:hypothetical protein [Commensalibacter communis]CAI3958476.1 unnamed protein product [Commensalibacter communis]CAI3960524.1 unnamed protein product [Commensalibacter communis]CAI3960637.1 unnamed protein product [Commensalibacter communis]CAI3960656.1 unnamed protein product [Commensalibacter communis]